MACIEEKQHLSYNPRLENSFYDIFNLDFIAYKLACRWSVTKGIYRLDTFRQNKGNERLKKI